MATILFNDLFENQVQTVEDTTLIRGGAWYAKFDGVDGSSTSTVGTRAIIAICDGAVLNY